jgi:hypothetical protein
MSREHPIADGLASPAIDVRAVLGTAGAVVLMLAIVIGATYWFFRWHVPNEIVLVPHEFPQPRQLNDETLELKRVQAEQRKNLQSWAWVDRSNGVISIPIEEAMRTIAARGADAYAPIVAPPAQQSGGRP